jgi:cell division protein FtsI (penicillin-binding protein 3)
MIVDRSGFPLAISTSVYSIWANPQVFSADKKALSKLSHLIDVSPKQILNLVEKSREKKREFVYLKRAVAPDLADKVKELSISGIHLQQAYKRYYPEGELTAHVIGLTNIDDQGQEGLELIYNQWLQGEPGKKWVMKDRIGRVVADVQSISTQKPGHDLVLSIDKRIQYLAYRALLSGMITNQAESGSAIVMDAKTGEILAMVNLPSYNPNHKQGVKRSHIRNRAVTDLFEPGSTIKAFTIASALESGQFKVGSVIDTSPGWMRVDHNVVKDENNNGLLSLSQILQVSSNMGAAKIVLALPPDTLWNVLHYVGFGENTGIDFPGEQTGVLIKHHPWGRFVLATLSFGYGMSVTALQLTRAYAVLANHGVKLPASLLRLDQAPKGERVLGRTVADQMLTLLEAVLAKGGTGQTITVPGYRVAGKTGTARKTSAFGGYQKHEYTSSFVGIAPVSDPRLIVTVVIHQPHGKHYYGGLVAGPVFQTIMTETLRVLDVPPDAA